MDFLFRFIFLVSSIFFIIAGIRSINKGKIYLGFPLKTGEPLTGRIVTLLGIIIASGGVICFISQIYAIVYDNHSIGDFGIAMLVFPGVIGGLFSMVYQLVRQHSGIEEISTPDEDVD